MSQLLLEREDDHETLEAALALIDEWELELSACTTSSSSSSPLESVSSDAQSPSTSSYDSGDRHESASSSSSSSSTETTVKQAPSRRRKAPSSDHTPATAGVVPVQMQRREELVFLRRTVKELEAQLAAASAASAHESQQPTTTGDPSSAVSATWVWQQIASRQLKQRQQSQQENTKLRVMVDEQLQIAKELMRVLLRAYQSDQNDTDSHLEYSAAKRVKLPKNALHEVSEETQRQNTEELFHEAKTIFAAPPFVDGNKQVFREVAVLEHENGETTVNVDSCWVLPFSVHQVASAYWKYLIKKTTATKGCHFDECEDDGTDTITTEYESNASANRLIGKFIGRFVARRFYAQDEKDHKDDNDERVMIMDLRSQPVDFKPMSMDGVRLHTESIMRVVAANEEDEGGEAGGAGSAMTKIQICERVHVKFATCETPTRRRRVDALTNLMFYTVERDLQWKQQVLEDLLMRQSLG